MDSDLQLRLGLDFGVYFGMVLVSAWQRIGGVGGAGMPSGQVPVLLEA